MFVPAFFLLIFLSVHIPAIFAQDAAHDEERHTSMFKVGDEWLALPEVFSNLDFAADSTPAPDDDVEAQLRLRSTRFWGRLYLDGWPQTIQYFRAHFGIEPPLGRKRFVFAEPRDACVDLENADLIHKNHVLLVHRGTCTFGTKAKIAEKAGAGGIIIINNEPGIDHLPGPDAHDIQFFVASITQQEGQLLEAIIDDGPNEDGLGRKIEGYMVPVNCAKNGAKCGPATVQERNDITNLIEGGEVLIYRNGESQPATDPKDFPVEYLLAHFGTKVTHENTTMSVVVAKPAEACTPIENDIRGKAVLIRRGSCPFVKKAEEIQAAGGRTMIVGNSFSYLVRMGVEPRWKGLNTVIPVIMVSKKGYGMLVAESYTGGKIALKEDQGINGKKTINSEVWEMIEKLHKGEGWPRSDVYVQKRYDELMAEHGQWPDRVAALSEAFHHRMKQASASTTTHGAQGSANQQGHQQQEPQHQDAKSDL